jgi:hypothetical protein
MVALTGKQHKAEEKTTDKNPRQQLMRSFVGRGARVCGVRQGKGRHIGR